MNRISLWLHINLVALSETKYLITKKTVDVINVNGKAYLALCKDLCDRSSSAFCDQQHNHIITGHLRLVANSKLRKLLTKGPNFRENRTISFRVGCLTKNQGSNKSMYR